MGRKVKIAVENLDDPHLSRRFGQCFSDPRNLEWSLFYDACDPPHVTLDMNLFPGRTPP